MVQVVTDLGRAQSLVARHLHDRTTVRRGTYTWEVDVAGGCQCPVAVSVTGVGSRLLPRDRHPNGAVKKLWVDLWARCRKCAWCLRRRARDWAERIVREFRPSQRSWLLTVTLRPDAHYLMGVRGGAQDFLGCHRAIRRELTLYIKRLRKAGVRMRYMLVGEPHPGGGENAGKPHYHAVVHEIGFPPGAVFRQRTQWGEKWRGVFHEQWPWGYVDLQLLDISVPLRAARYVAKYLAKSAQTRVRASVNYGGPRDIVNDAASAEALAGDGENVQGHDHAPPPKTSSFLSFPVRSRPSTVRVEEGAVSSKRVDSG